MTWSLIGGKREPIDTEKVRTLLTDRFDDALRRRVRLFPAERSAGISIHGMIGRSVPMQRLFQMLRTMAPDVRTALVTGETETAKELVARALHQLGARADRRCVVINCSAVVETLLESELSGHVRRPSRVRPTASQACSSWPTVARCSSTKCDRRGQSAMHSHTTRPSPNCFAAAPHNADPDVVQAFTRLPGIAG